jgi:L-rhamnose mutarotase
MVQRYGQVIGVRAESIDEYEHLHAAVWPEVLATIHACGIRNYSIFRHGTILFAYFDYVGDNFAADMALMAADPKTQEWWKHTDPMQEPVSDRAPGEWWHTLSEIFHAD